ncbi:MAG: 4Fe-4S binding protein [Desulfobacula sp.]|nr:4Fe-4S binding protein [Desulfobacula sp.]
MLKMTANILRTLFSKKPTRLYPIEVRTPFEIARGKLVNEIENCNFCSICALKCPSQCISVDKKAATWTCDPFACVYCGICVEACPFKCLHQEQAQRRPAYERQILLKKGLPH